MTSVQHVYELSSHSIVSSDPLANPGNVTLSENCDHEEEKFLQISQQEPASIILILERGKLGDLVCWDSYKPLFLCLEDSLDCTPNT